MRNRRLAGRLGCAWRISLAPPRHRSTVGGAVDVPRFQSPAATVMTVSRTSLDPWGCRSLTHGSGTARAEILHGPTSAPFWNTSSGFVSPDGSKTPLSAVKVSTSGCVAGAAGASTCTWRPANSYPAGAVTVDDVSTMRSAPTVGDVMVAAIGSTGGSIEVLSTVPDGVLATSSIRQLPSHPSSGWVFPSSHSSPGSTIPFPQ